jgi:integrase
MSAENWGGGRLYRRISKKKKVGKVWWLQYSIRGKMFRESSHSERKAVAAKLLRLRVGEGASGRVVIAQTAERVTLGAMLKALAEDYARKGNRATIGRAMHYLLGHFGEHARAISITRDAINGYIAARREMMLMRATGKEIVKDGKTVVERILRPPSNGTIILELAALRRAFAVMVEARKLSRDHVPVMPMLPKPKPRQGFLEPADFERLCAALPEHLHDPVRFLYLSGWRKEEMHTLEWRDVELEHDRSGAIIGGVIRLRAERSKNKKSRMLPLSDDLLAIIAHTNAGRTLACPNVFQHDGKPIGSFRKAWLAACKAAGFGGLLVHDLRRSCVRNLVRAGVPESVAMKITGHLTRTIFDRYDIVAASDLEAAMTKVSGYVRERAQEKPKVVPLRKTA